MWFTFDPLSRSSSMTIHKAVKTTTMIDVSILIVCYKSKDLIEQCLRGVYEQTCGCQFEVLLVDCSNDGTTDLVRARFPQTRVIESSENLGFGRGNNFLASHATGQYLILLNPDVIVSDDSIGELYRTAVAMPKAGAIGGRARLPDGKRDPGCRQCVPSLFRMIVAAVGGAKFLNGALPENATDAAEVETLSGAFMLVRRDAWEQAQGFDTSFFMYSEELDLCERIRKNGWLIVMTPRAEIIHLVGGGQGQSSRRILLITKARMHYCRKYWNRPKVVLGGLVMWTHALIRVVIGSVAGVALGANRARQLKEAYAGIVLQPGSWWFGFRENTPN
jgi:N-acetylglucosaminyl-diphospho-decaprenol L-rhamnosyltransferase